MNARKVGVLDRNYAAGIGGIFCQDTRACLQGVDGVQVQGYLAGVGGGDVTPALVAEAIDDLCSREQSGSPRWMGIDT
jgi:pyruvate/2-oxoacid:ferredoxin oxidoreductase alpha subunit